MEQQRRGSKTREDIAEGLYRGSKLLVRHLARGTSLAHRTVLATLEEDGPTRLTALATASGVSQPAMTQTVGRLERDGLVIRLIDPDDARATLVDITDTGRALRAELHEAQNDQLAELLETLSPEDEATLGLAMRVALPLIQRLTQQATSMNGASPATRSTPNGSGASRR
jgi:DNA-binding MarR family transcriptional regulator